MNREIERKYLVCGEFKDKAVRSYHIEQAYLCTDSQQIIRVRITPDRAVLTIKGAQKGLSRFEWEQEVACYSIDIVVRARKN